jgi:Family of unknown function (DUF6499)
MNPGDQSSSVPDWLPDWTEITGYPSKTEKNPRTWAWEFLRRNPEYQKVWEQIEALPPGPIQHDLSLADILERLEIDFGLRSPAPPSMGSADPNFKTRPQFVTHGKIWFKPVGWPSEAGPYVVNELLDDTEVLFQVDLRLPLERQMCVAKTFLKTQKQHLQSLKIIDAKDRRISSQGYRDFLRLLDAEAAGQTLKKMAQAIYGIVDKYPVHTGQQQASENLQRAKWFRDKGYRYIAMSIQA